MTNEEFLLSKCPKPMDSDDLVGFYDQLCEYQQSHMSSESFKRLCRKVAQKSRDGITINSTLEKTLKDKEVLLDSLNETDNKLEVSLRSYKIQDVETAAQIAGIDLTEWKCTRKKVRASQNASNPYFIVEGAFAPREHDDLSMEEMVENFKDAIKNYQPPTFPAPKVDPLVEDIMAEIAVMDFHFGQECWNKETRDLDYNIEVASKLLDDTIDYFIQHTEGQVGKYLLPIGNDFFNVNSKANTTAGNTPQDEDSNYKKTHISAEKLWIRQIDKLASIAPVHVSMVSGNHDFDRLFYLGEYLSAWYRNTDFVTIDNSPPTRKYIRWGKALIGYTHGDKEVKGSLPLLMAQEMPIDFSQTKYRSWHLGHFHSMAEKNTRLVKETQGIREMILPSLASTDSWHSGKGYSHLTEALCFFWDKKKGNTMTRYYHP